MSLDVAISSVQKTVPECVAVGFVDMKTGMLLGVRTVDSHPQEFWDGSFYNGWLSAIRALSDNADFESRPEPMRTAAWADKGLNTQAASWRSSTSSSRTRASPGASTPTPTSSRSRTSTTASPTSATSAAR